jgi:hypothetical protein
MAPHNIRCLNLLLLPNQVFKDLHRSNLPSNKVVIPDQPMGTLNLLNLHPLLVLTRVGVF